MELVEEAEESCRVVRQSGGPQTGRPLSRETSSEDLQPGHMHLVCLVPAGAE